MRFIKDIKKKKNDLNIQEHYKILRYEVNICELLDTETRTTLNPNSSLEFQKREAPQTNLCDDLSPLHKLNDPDEVQPGRGPWAKLPLAETCPQPGVKSEKCLSSIGVSEFPSIAECKHGHSGSFFC